MSCLFQASSASKRIFINSKDTKEKGQNTGLGSQYESKWYLIGLEINVNHWNKDKKKRPF